MQGTIAMLMALSGLGCHHKACAPAYVDSCYASSCYSSCYASEVVYSSGQAFGSCYGSSCYGSYYESGYNSCYGSCYGSCYSAPARKCGLFGGMFGHHKKRAVVVDSCCNLGYVAACYSTPVYGSYTPAFASAQGVSYAAPQGAGLNYSSQGVYGSTQGTGMMGGPPTTSPMTDNAPAPAPAPRPEAGTPPPPPAPETPAATAPPAAPTPAPDAPKF